MWNFFKINFNYCIVTQIREFGGGRTKPRWLPKAKSKIFRVPPRRCLPPDEEAERLRLMKLYNTQKKTMFNVYQQLYRDNITSDEVIAKEKEELEKVWAENMKINDEWNAQVGLEREQTNAVELQKKIEQAKERMIKVDEERLKEKTRIDDFIRQQKELSKTFITKANIDAHLEKILSSPPISFNFAIDLNGNVYEGESRTPNPDKRLHSISTVMNDDTDESQNQISN